MTDIKRTLMGDRDNPRMTSSEAMKRIARACGALRIDDIKNASDEQRELILEHGIANTLPPMPAVAVSLDIIPETEEQWQTCLADVRDRAKESLRDYCVRIYQYKESCEPSTFCKTAVDLLKISESQAIKMALVGADEHIRTANVEDLPSSLETLYLTTTLTDEKKHEAFDSGAINSKTTRADVQQMKRPKPVERPTVIPAQVEDAVIIPPDDPEAVEVIIMNGRVADDGDKYLMPEKLRLKLLKQVERVERLVTEHNETIAAMAWEINTEVVNVNKSLKAATDESYDDFYEGDLLEQEVNQWTFDVYPEDTLKELKK